MEKHFAYGCSGGTNIINVQLAFWRRSISVFHMIAERFRECAFEGADFTDASLDYNMDDFRIDAWMGLVDAGTSLSILTGQNVRPELRGEKWRTPGVKKALIHDLELVLDGDEIDFIETYDNLRHFGPSKYDIAIDLDTERYCGLMRIAQSLWKRVLEAKRLSDEGLFGENFHLE